MGLQIKISKKIYLKQNDKVIFKCHHPAQGRSYKSTIKMPGHFSGTCSLWITSQSIVITRKLAGKEVYWDGDNTKTSDYIDVIFDEDIVVSFHQFLFTIAMIFSFLTFLMLAMYISSDYASALVWHKLIKGNTHSLSSQNDIYKMSLNNDDKCVVNIIDIHGKMRQKKLVDDDCSSIQFAKTNIYALNYNKTIIWSFFSIFDEEPIYSKMDNDGSFCSYHNDTNEIKKCFFQKAKTK